MSWTKTSIILAGNEKILLLTSAGIGDFSKNLGIVNSIKERYPKTVIDVLALHGAIRELARFNNHITEVHVVSFGAFTLKNYFRYFFFRGIRDLIKLNRKKYDIVLCPQINYLRIYLMAFLFRPRKIVMPGRIHEVRREYEILKRIGIDGVSRRPFLNNRALLDSIAASDEIKQAASGDRIIVISMFCADSPVSIRDWGKWGTLVDLLHRDGYRIILVGKADFDYRSHYSLDYGKVIDCVNRTVSVDELIYIIMRSRLTIAVDSFLFHLCYALNRKVVGLFGPVNPAHRVPPGIDGRNVSVIYKSVRCAPCLTYHHLITCGNASEPNICMEGISADEVYEKVMEMV